jgi:Carbohydrate family 9 binding domain-like
MHYLSRVRYLIIFIGLTITTSDLHGQTKSDSSSAPLYIEHSDDFLLKGDGEEPAWSKTRWIQINPGNSTGSQQSTRVKMLYSDKGVYALFSCEDKKITATMTKDFSNLFLEDVVEMFLWPDDSIPIYLEYELSPLDKELIILVPNLNHRFYGWQPWHFEGDRATRHAVKIVRNKNQIESWTAEVFIPWSVMQPLLKSQPKKGDKWRINLYRIDYDNGFTTWTWKKIINNFHDYEHYGTAIFD